VALEAWGRDGGHAPLGAAVGNAGQLPVSKDLRIFRGRGEERGDSRDGDRVDRVNCAWGVSEFLMGR